MCDTIINKCTTIKSWYSRVSFQFHFDYQTLSTIKLTAVKKKNNQAYDFIKIKQFRRFSIQ